MSEAVEFDTFVRAATPALLRTATLLAGSEDAGRDLLQAALAKSILRWRTIDNPTAYVRRTMATTLIDWSRKRRLREVRLDLVEPVVQDQTHDIDDRESALVLLRSLPVNQRAVLVLRFYDDLTEQGTADALGISVGAVESATSRGLAALRTRLAEEVEG